MTIQNAAIWSGPHKPSAKVRAVRCLQGRHQINDADDLLARRRGKVWFRDAASTTLNTHGTGCAVQRHYSRNLARAASLDTPVVARRFIWARWHIKTSPRLRPMNHMFTEAGSFVE